MVKCTITSGRGARAFVQSREAFRNHNRQLYGYWVNPFLYVVYSYGEHWPLLMYSTDTARWYENEDKFSVTTSKHRSYTHPLCYTELRSCAWMKEAIRRGTAFILLSHCQEEKEPVDA